MEAGQEGLEIPGRISYWDGFHPRCEQFRISYNGRDFNLTDAFRAGRPTDLCHQREPIYFVMYPNPNGLQGMACNGTPPAALSPKIIQGDG
jgi:hypothetical protein